MFAKHLCNERQGDPVYAQLRKVMVVDPAVVWPYLELHFVVANLNKYWTNKGDIS